MFGTSNLVKVSLFLVVGLVLLGNRAPKIFCESDGCIEEPFRVFCDAVISCSIEDNRDGFHTVRRSQQVEGGLESIGHFDILFWRTTELGQTSFKALAPSGRFGLFTTPEGHLQLFDGQTRIQHDLFEGVPKVVSKARWAEDEAVVWVTLRDAGEEERIELPR